jgi:hypothetical protein
MDLQEHRQWGKRLLLFKDVLTDFGMSFDSRTPQARAARQVKRQLAALLSTMDKLVIDQFWRPGDRLKVGRIYYRPPRARPRPIKQKPRSKVVKSV